MCRTGTSKVAGAQQVAPERSEQCVQAGTLAAIDIKVTESNSVDHDAAMLSIRDADFIPSHT